MPIVIDRNHKIRSLYRRARRIRRIALLTAASLFVAYEMVWITWVMAVGYDDMTFAQKEKAAAHFVPDVMSAFTFGRL